ncbi:MAG TPA: efflux RND transporter periplasmic adaptor subunit [Pirellulales bacterium]|jgi:cobalt-zinc-cadmium efflux system membrane fusion protein|nr:efflux RND transporter periplasmic adaptor subunit [Pirellulales bacterium]
MSVETSKTSFTGMFRRVAGARGQRSTVLVMLALCGAAYWGHTTGWTIPKFSQLVGGRTKDDALWCEAHGVPEDLCIECNVELHPPEKDYGWCDAHGVPQCPLEHPEIAETKSPVSLTDADRERAARALALRPRAENNSRCKTHLRRVQFATVEAAEKSGIDVAVVDREPITEAISANGEVVYDQTRVAHLSSRVKGTVLSVSRQVGDRVTKNELLALVDSADVGKAKAEFLSALTRERLTAENVAKIAPLAQQGTIAERQWRETTAAHHEAQIRLMSARQALVNLGFSIPKDNYGTTNVEEVSRQIQFLGIPSELTGSWDAAMSSSNLYPLRAPLAGVVVDRDVVEGEVVDTAKPLFSIGDVSRMWLLLDVRQDDIDLVQIGAPVKFRPSSQPRAAEVTGRIAWISTEADERTRTVKVRVELPNDGRLRAYTFGMGRIVLRGESDAIVVPNEAVHWDGCCNVVFVRDRHYFEPDAPKFYHVRKVRLGVKQDDRSEIIAGLVPGEVIAAKGSNVLASQLLRSNLGEGCGCAHGH